MNLIIVDATTWNSMQSAIARIDANVSQLRSQLSSVLTNQTKELNTMSQISDAVAAMTAKVTQVQGTEASTLTFIQQLVALYQAAVANAADDAAAVAAVTALTAQLSASDDPLAGAVAANPLPPATPAARP